VPLRAYRPAEVPVPTTEPPSAAAARTLAWATHCPYCSLQCGMHLEPDSNAAWKVTERNFPTNRGGLCQKGWSSAELLSHPGRLLTPLVRDSRSEPLRTATWDEATERIVRAIEAAQLKYGLDAVGLFGGGSLTNEKAYLLGKFARVALRTSQIDYNGRFCMASAAAAAIKAFGIDRGLPFPLTDIPGAEVILLVGSNLAETMPPVMQHFVAQKNRGGSLIVVDPRSTPTTAAATLHLQITPGTDAALANGLLNLAIREGFIDEAFIAERTNDFDLVKRAVSSYWPERVERITGIPEHQLRRAAGMLGRAKSAMILTARGPEQQSRGVNNVLAFINLALALGTVGKPNSGYGCLTGQGNGQGGREHGQKADQLPGYRKLDNPAHRAHMAHFWGVAESELPKPGRSAYEMLDAMGTPEGIRALLVFGSNMAVSAPRARHMEERLKSLDFLAVSDFFLSETAAHADVVLPSAQWAEEAGTMTNLEGRVILRRRAMLPPAGVRTDLEIIFRLAARLGYENKFSSQPAAVFEELRRATSGGVADYAGITWDRIRESDGIFWPCPDEDHPGTPRLFLNRFPTEDGRARFHAIAFQPPAELPDDEYPLYLTTGRIMAQYQSGTQTRRVAALQAAAPEAFVQMHPSMAQTYGIAGGDDVVLTTRRGSAVMKAQLTPSIRLDTLFVPFHYAGRGSANLLTNPALDPVSRMPEFKVCAVRIEKSIADSEIHS
jgi:assimilatory nitrate reductase catalytic subunit